MWSAVSHYSKNLRIHHRLIGTRTLGNEQRIIDLERELIETRRAAVSIIVGMTETQSEEGRLRIASGLETQAGACDAAKARLARLIAAALRRH